MEALDTVLASCRGQVLLLSVGVQGKCCNIFHGDPHSLGVEGQLPGGGGGHVVTPASIAPASPHPS